MGYVFVPHEICNSYYYKWVLDSNDKIVLQGLFGKVLVGKNKYYTNGLLVANTKIKTLGLDVGLSWSSTKRSLDKLNRLGVIIKLNRVLKNNRYFLGFRKKDEQRMYLIDHLINKYRDVLKEGVEKQTLLSNKQINTIKIPAEEFLSINNDYREFIIDNIDTPKILINIRLKDNKNIVNLMFPNETIYKEIFPWSRHVQAHEFKPSESPLRTFGSRR